MTPKAIIVTGGSGPSGPVDFLVHGKDLVICADSGYELAQTLGLQVDLWVGDFDSTRVPIDEAGGTHIMQSPPDKDFSDTELALIEARKAGYSQWVLLGGGGRRIDHLINTWALFSTYGPPLVWQTEDETMHLVRDERTFGGLGEGQTVSFLPALIDGWTSVTAGELVWPLERRRIDNTLISLSNRCIDGTLTVRIDGGCGALVCFPVAPIRL
jgi:thiamine pyrophosphokinase